jgi:hypothetical protein
MIRKRRPSKPEVPPTSLRFPPEIKKVLQEEADRLQRPFSYLVFNILRQWCAFAGAREGARKRFPTEEERK